MSSNFLNALPLYQTVPSTSQWASITSSITIQSQLADTLWSGDTLPANITALQTAAGSPTASIAFKDIDKYASFALFKPMKPKLVFGRYTSRVLPFNLGGQGNATVFNPTVQFQIQFDGSCVGSMVLHWTCDIEVKEFSQININGYSAQGTQYGITVPREKVNSVQYSYGTDFMYNVIDYIYLGFANSGGNAPQWHQQVPIEYAKIYHSIIEDPGMSETIMRLAREDVFKLQHDPYHNFGHFDFQIKQDIDLAANTTVTGKNFQKQVPTGLPNGFNEYAMYWVDTTIDTVTMTNKVASADANLDKWIVSFNDQSKFENITQNGKQLTGFSFNSLLNWNFGNGSTFKFTIDPLIESFGLLVDGNIVNTPMVDAGVINMPPEAVENIDGTYTVPIKIANCPVMLISTDDDNKCAKLLEQFADKYTDQLPQFKIQWTNAQFIAQKPSTISEIITFVPYMRVTTKGYSINFSMVSSNKVTPTQQNVFKYPQFKHISIENDSCTLGIQIPDNVMVIDQTHTNIIQYTIPFDYDNGQLQLDVASYDQYKSQEFLVIGNASVIKSQSGLTGQFFRQSEDGQSMEGIPLTSVVNQTLMQFSDLILHATGCIAPFANQANVAYMGITTETYDNSDFMLESLLMYSTNKLLPGGNQSYQPSFNNVSNQEQIISLYKYNACILNNKPTSDYAPTIQNCDYRSIHVMRKSHGIVDFYMPLSFLFICQGVKNSFPMYCAAAQTIMVQINFTNPFAWMNTCVSVVPSAIDPLDINENERLFINRVAPASILTSNISNMKYVLFYTRYQFIQQVIPAITNYAAYSWIIKNFERQTNRVSASSSQTVTIGTLAKPVYYTKLWLFCCNSSTIDVIVNQGQNLNSIPIRANRYDLPIEEVTNFPISVNQSGSSIAMTGSDALTAYSQANSVYTMTAFDSLQMISANSLQIDDNKPERFCKFNDYVCLDHKQVHSSIKFNNLTQFNIDPIYYQADSANNMQSPVYQPQFSLQGTGRINQNNQIGTILIAEYINLSFISSHTIMLKFASQ